MSFIDYVIDILLIAVVLRQMRIQELTPRSVSLPLVLVGIACLNYLRPFMPDANDVLLIVVLTVAGVVLGLLSGLVTDVWREGDGSVLAQAGYGAAALWVAGMGFRFAFAVWSTGSGSAVVARFSAAHAITGARAWTTALVLMAVGEVAARVVVLQLRRTHVQHPRTLTATSRATDQGSPVPSTSGSANPSVQSTPTGMG